jgi:hypothetical protein
MNTTETDGESTCEELSELTQYSRLVMIQQFFRFNQRFVRGEVGIPVGMLWKERMRYKTEKGSQSRVLSS